METTEAVAILETKAFTEMRITPQENPPLFTETKYSFDNIQLPTMENTEEWSATDGGGFVSRAGCCRRHCSW